MASRENINQALTRVAKFLGPLVSVAGCHMVDYLTSDHWDSLLPPPLQSDLLRLSHHELLVLPSASFAFDSDGDTDTSKDFNLSTCNLISFLKAVHDHSLPSLGVTTSLQEVFALYGSSDVTTLKIKGIMSEKKTHEVEVMSRVVAQLAKGCKVEWIVDLGSGRGYLSSTLALQYGLNVVAIDSSKSNTSSALIRKNKLQRHWEKLKQAEQDRMEGKSIKKGKTRRKGGNSKLNSASRGKIDLAENLNKCRRSRCGTFGKYIGLTKFITDDTDLVEIVRTVVSGERYIDSSIHEDESNIEGSMYEENNLEGSTHDKNHLEGSYEYRVNKITNGETTRPAENQIPRVSRESVAYQNLQTDNKPVASQSLQADYELSVHQRLRVDHKFSENLKKLNLNSENYSKTGEEYINSENLVSNTMDAEGCMSGLGLKNLAAEEEGVSHIGLVGLHTCGNLASSSLQLFLANSEVDFICNVGCCYHLIEEEFSQNVFIQKKANYVQPVSQTSQNDAVILPYDMNSSCSGDGQCEFDSKLVKTGYVKNFKPPDILDISHGSADGDLEYHGQCLCDSKLVKELCSKSVKPPDDIEDITHGSVADLESLPLNPLCPSEIPNLGYGFPLSSILKREKFVLGRNSRMLSCQPAERLTQEDFGGTETLFWRALLQLLLREKLVDVADVVHVGRIATKCNNFPEYARMALAKLGITLEVTQEDLEQFYRQHKHNIPKLERFFLLRASLAPVIEGLILLDRLAFLREQEGNISAYLVQLFNPVTSPRCHAIIALRDHQSSV
ncbi:hypothetical protein OTU49_013985 [Cherax quadricarinatus]|uniref:Methyltransferase domain-containing protein n=2 Tax=Cherax quadricarinatus TaxID=27406 RepID=A0AAW0VRG8_CHEQU